MSRLVWHDPAAVEPQGFDYTDYLFELGIGVTLDTSAWTVSAGYWDVAALGEAPESDPAPLSLSSQQIISAGLKTQVTLTAGYAPAGPPGTKGYRYWVTNHFTTSSGVVDERSFEVQVVQR